MRGVSTETAGRQAGLRIRSQLEDHRQGFCVPSRNQESFRARRSASLLQRRAGRRNWAAPDVVALEFAVQGGAADAEHLPGQGLVTFYLLEHPFNRGALNVLEVGRCKPGA